MKAFDDLQQKTTLHIGRDVFDSYAIENKALVSNEWILKKYQFKLELQKLIKLGFLSL